MFDLGWDEMAVIAVVALVVLGPKELPNALRTVTGLMKQARKLANEFQSGVHEIIREAELEDAKKAIADLKKGDIAGAIEKHLDSDGEIKAALQQPRDEDAVNPAAIAENSVTTPAITDAKAEEAAATSGEPEIDPAAIDPAAIDPAAIDPAAIDPAAIDPAAINPAVAAYAPGGSATQLPEFAHEEALGAAHDLTSDAPPLIEGEPTATPVETQPLNFGHEDELQQASAGNVAPVDDAAEHKIGGDKEKSKIS